MQDARSDPFEENLLDIGSRKTWTSWSPVFKSGRAQLATRAEMSALDSSDTSIYSMSDASWTTRHSTSGSVVMFGEAAIMWSSKKQPSVALSSCEAEIMAASEACKETLYVRNFLSELDVGDATATRLSVDNKAAIDLAYNPEHHQRTKHIERRHFFVREVVESGRLVVPFVASANNLADFFTKPLDSKKFFEMRNRIMNVCQDAHTHRGVSQTSGP